MTGKISSMDWVNIVTAYQRGEKNMVELAADHGVSVKAISKGLRERGVTRASKLNENIVDEEDQARKDIEQAVAKAKASKERYAKFNDAIAQMVMKRVIDGDRDQNLKNFNADILVLNNASKVIQRSRRENWEILDIDKVLEGEDALPDLNVGEYTPEELEEIRAANEEHYLESQEAAPEYDDEPSEDPDGDD